MESCLQIIESLTEDCNFKAASETDAAFFMDLISFKNSLQQSNPPEELTIYLQALWQDGKGKWEAAHILIQDIENHDGSWIHAYLHRKEGDIGNADYWYRRAQQKRPDLSLEKEWEALVTHFLKA